MKLAAACLLLTLGAAAATPTPKNFGTVVKSSSKISPGADGPVFREGRVTIALEKSGDEQEFKATPKTKITLDGKPAKFKAALPGTAVLRVTLDPKTRSLASLDLKSAPRAEQPASPGAAGSASGEVANTDVFKGVLSMRLGRQSIRDYAIKDTTRLVRVSGSQTTPIGFDELRVGDAIEVNSKDGDVADEILVRAAP
ncbi:MAG: hypothetical protein HY923_06745 [Elusimicrobia bacterium]|nr:hypothetical protein [Elusimicrobiota bacterium]